MAKYIFLKRFQAISRYLKINPPEDLPNDQWWQKVESLTSAFRIATTSELYDLPRNLGIDKQFVQFTGRSKHTIQMNSKAAGKGYKIYSLCCPNCYMIDFRYTSAEQKVAELRPCPDKSQTEAVVLDLAKTLLTRFGKSTPYYVLHLDNFFTRYTLYEELYARGIGANGTAKAGSGIPKELILLQDVMTKQINHEEWYNYVIGNVNCIAFCDMATTSIMTTVHDPTEEDYVWYDEIKRPGASLTNAKPTVSSNNISTWRIRKLNGAHDYNQNMGGSDSHAQQNSYYSTSQH